MPDSEVSMNELGDAREITDTPEHWASLAERIASRAIRASNGIEWLAHSRTGWMAACVVLAASIGFVVSEPSRSTASLRQDEWIGALTPRGETAQAMLTRDQPPSLGSLAFPSSAEAR